jgi:hypothetical protein
MRCPSAAGFPIQKGKTGRKDKGGKTREEKQGRKNKGGKTRAGVAACPRA